MSISPGEETSNVPNGPITHFYSLFREIVTTPGHFIKKDFHHSDFVIRH